MAVEHGGEHVRKIEGQLAAGTYEAVARGSWDDFITKYESNVLAGMEPGNREATQYALDHFTRIIKPVKMQGITSETIATYVAVRRLEPSTGHGRSRLRTRRPPAKVAKKKATVKDWPRVSPATVNKEFAVAPRHDPRQHGGGMAVTKTPESNF